MSEERTATCSTTSRPCRCSTETFLHDANETTTASFGRPRNAEDGNKGESALVGDEKEVIRLSPFGVLVQLLDRVTLQILTRE